jgi:hypothetical protein
MRHSGVGGRVASQTEEEPLKADIAKFPAQQNEQVLMQLLKNNFPPRKRL